MVERRIQLVVAACAIAALATACASAPMAGTPSDRADQRNARDDSRGATTMHPASASLLQQASEQRRAGNVAQAAATLERAVRIDPGEPAVWLALARLRSLESNWRQAEQLARKAHSLAAPGSAVATAAQDVIAEALTMQGRGAG